MTLTVSAAAETFVVPLANKPSQVILDPGNHVLKTLDEKKADELWTRAARGRPSAPSIECEPPARSARRAARPRSRRWSSRCAPTPVWMVRGEAALALGAIKTDAARDAIAAAVAGEPHPKARRHLVRALGAFRHDARAAGAIERRWPKDASYFVEAESAISLAKTRSPGAFDKLVAAMTRPSYLDVIQSMCLSGMAELRDERGIDLALAAGAATASRVIGRRAAIAALGALGAEFTPRRRRVRSADRAAGRPRLPARIAAVEALRVLGEPDAIGALEQAERSISTAGCAGARARWRASWRRAARRRSRSGPARRGGEVARRKP